MTDWSFFVFSTFLKRKGGLFKKAHELAVLCSVDVAVIIFGQNKKLYEYSSCDMHDALGRYQYVSQNFFYARIFAAYFVASFWGLLSRFFGAFSEDGRRLFICILDSNFDSLVWSSPRA